MVEPKFEIGDKLISYKVKYIKGIFGSGNWEVEGETSSGKFKVSYEKSEQHLKHAGAKCLNWREVTF